MLVLTPIKRILERTIHITPLSSPFRDLTTYDRVRQTVKHIAELGLRACDEYASTRSPNLLRSVTVGHKTGIERSSVRVAVRITQTGSVIGTSHCRWTHAWIARAAKCRDLGHPRFIR